MDLISITEILWRRKFITIPVIILTAMAAFYVVKVKPPVYQAQASLLMVPPSPPTAGQIAADPALGKINSNNPYINYGDLSVIADTLIDVVTDPANEQVLVAQGADPRYELTLSTDYGNPPIIDITGIGRTPAIAIRSAQLVTKTAQQDLVTLQSSQGVNSLYMIKGTQLVTPAQASQSVSSKLRTLIAVLAIGILVLFVGVSLVEAVEKRRSQKARRAAANARSSPEEQPRGPIMSRYRTRGPGWAPAESASARIDDRADEPVGAFGRSPGVSPGRTSRLEYGAPSSAGHPDPAAPRREPRPGPDPSRQPADAPPSRQPSAAPSARQPASAPPARQPASAPPARQPASAPPARQPASVPPPARQPMAAPPARPPMAAPPARQPLSGPPARPGPLDRLPAGPTGRPGSPGE
jgi:capsular polysaccharide biosynthesis protein